MSLSLRLENEKFHEYSPAFQIAWFDDGGKITNLLTIDGDLFAMKVNGDFGRVVIGQSDQCSFSPLCEQKHECHQTCRHLLFHV